MEEPETIWSDGISNGKKKARMIRKSSANEGYGTEYHKRVSDVEVGVSGPRTSTYVQ